MTFLLLCINTAGHDHQLESEARELAARLKGESKEMLAKFSTLVTHTVKLFGDKKGTTIEDLILSIHHLRGHESDKSTLIKDLKRLKKEDVQEALLIMSDYWSFYDHELLSVIIKTFGSPELKFEHGEYVIELTRYCKRRLCEVHPSSKEKGIAHPKNVTIVLDEIFNIPLRYGNAIIRKLSRLLYPSFRLVGFEHVSLGCRLINPKDFSEKVGEIGKESGQPSPLTKSEPK